MKKHIILYSLIGLILLPVQAEAAPCPWWWPNCPWGDTTTTTTAVSTTTTTAISDPQMENYLSAPIFSVTEVTPNILIMLDNSGSMNHMAYGYESGDYQPHNFDPNVSYYGYFDSTITYSYASGKFSRDAVYTAGNWDGNFLNWLTMRRVDIARKVLVGGDASVRDGSGSTTLYGENSVQDWRRYIKFYEHSGDYTPYNDDHFFYIDSDGTFEVFEFRIPAEFNSSADFSYVCNGNSQRDWYFHDYLFNKDGDEYYIEYRNRPDPGCSDSHYTVKTIADRVASYTIIVEKNEATEPRLFLNGNIAGVIQAVGDKARFGLEFYNEYEGGRIENYVGGNLDDLVESIEDKGCNTWTPLAESFFEGVRYFRQDGPYYDSGDYTVSQNNDPFYFQDYGQYVECSKSFILLITDGESTMDLNIPSAYRDYDSDGNDDGLSPYDYDSDGSDYLDDVALWAHTNDARTGAKDLEGIQIINLFTVFAFGSGSQLLKDAAKNGGFIDKNDNGEPDLDSEWDKDGDGVPDNYLEAPDGNQLELKLALAITDILQKSASGTAVSVLSTSAEGEGSLFQAFFKTAVYEGLREVTWLGYLNAFWVDTQGNLREDSNSDNALVYGDDDIIRFDIDEETGDTVVKRYHDNTGGGPLKDQPDGLADSGTPYETVPMDELKPIWEGGKKLAQRDASERNIKTWVDIDGDSEVDNGEFIDFTVANAPTLRPFLNAADEAEAEDIIRFIRGESVSGYRDRNITVDGDEKVWKLGDIVYSTPTVVGKPMENYNQYYFDYFFGEFFLRWRERGISVYAGANDGMLHSFKAGTFNEGDNPATTGKEEHGWYSATEDPATSEDLGDERWAYIPYNLLPHLKWLTDPDYAHVYYTDLKPKVTDVRIFNDDNGHPIDDGNHPQGWGTILIGGMRLGGGALTLTDDFGDGPDETRTFRSAYFVLDITVPDSPVLLGEFTDPNLAFATSYPAIARVEETQGFDEHTHCAKFEDDKWYFIVGSGPTNYDGSSNQQGYTFVVDLNNGSGQLELVQTFTGNENEAFMATPVTIDLNLNYNVDIIYIGETYDDTGTWKGKMHRISTRSNDDDDPAPEPEDWPYKTDPTTDPWLMTTLFSADTPITASANATKDDDDNIWIYFGTGRYYDNTDKLDTTTQYFYGIKDACAYGVCGAEDEVLTTDLHDSTNVMVLINKEVVNATANNWDEFLEDVQEKEGWYLNLDTGGERVINRPSILSGVVLFPTFNPNADVCNYGGRGKLYALYYETGTAYYKAVLGTETYGDTEKSLISDETGPGVTSAVGIHVGEKSTGTGFIQQSTGVVVQIEIDPAFGMKSGIMAWKQK